MKQRTKLGVAAAGGCHSLISSSLGEDVEHETVRTLVGSIVVGVAVLTVCDPPRLG